MSVKQFIEPELERRIVVMTSLDVQGAFDAAWWLAILRGLRDTDCPQNLYQHRITSRTEEQLCFLIARN